MSRNVEIMRFFQYEHLPEGPLRETSKMFSDLADKVDGKLIGNEQQRLALLLLLQAKDAAVRSAMDLHKDEEL